MKDFAEIVEFKELYEKVVPPIAIFEEKNEKLLRRVQKLNGIVKRFDEALTVKANKQEMMDIDNKFRWFTKCKDFEDYQKQVKSEIAITASEAQDAKALMRELKI